MTARLVIRGRLPGLNEYVDAERGHRQKGARLKRETQTAVCMAIRTQLRGVRFDKPVRMHYVWIERDKRRDKDNICGYGRKVIQDALVQCKVLKNDGWGEIIGFADDFAVDKKAPRVEVLISDEV